MAGALAAAGLAYSTGGPNAQLVGQDRVYGGGHFIVPDSLGGGVRTFAIDAHSSGDIEYGGLLHWAHEQVTCLNVVGNSATVGAIVTDTDRLPPSAFSCCGSCRTTGT